MKSRLSKEEIGDLISNISNIENEWTKGKKIIEISTEICMLEDNNFKKFFFEQIFQITKKIKSGLSKFNAISGISNSIYNNTKITEGKYEIYEIILETIKTIEENGHKTNCIIEVVKNIAQSKDLQFKKELLDKYLLESLEIKDFECQSYSFLSIARAFLEINNKKKYYFLINKAFKNIKKLELDFLKIKISLEIVKNTLDLNNNFLRKNLMLLKVFNIINILKDGEDKLKFIEELLNYTSKIVNNFQKYFFYNKVFYIIKKIKSPEIKSSSLSKLALSIIKENKIYKKTIFKNILKILKKIDDKYSSEAFLDIIYNLITLNDFNQALKSAKEIDNEISKSKALTIIANSMANFQDITNVSHILDKLLKIANNINSIFQKIIALLQISEVMSRLEKDRASEILLRTLDMTLKIESNDLKFKALMEITTVIANCKYFSNRRNLFKDIIKKSNSMSEKYNALFLLKSVEILSKSGEKKEAFNIFQDFIKFLNKTSQDLIEVKTNIPFALHEMIKNVELEVDFKNAMSIIKILDDQNIKYNALNNLIENIMQSESIEDSFFILKELLDISKSLNNELKSNILPNLAVNIIQIENLSRRYELFYELLKILETLESDWKSYALSGIALSLSQVNEPLERERLTDKILIIFESLEDKWKPIALSGIMLTTFEMENLVEISNILKRILNSISKMEKESFKCEALVEIIDAISQNENLLENSEISIKTLEIIDNITEENCKNEILAKIYLILKTYET